MTSINLVLRPSQKEGNCLGSLSLRLIHERQVKSVTLKGYRLYKDEWDQDKQSVIYPLDDSLRSSYLQQVEEALRYETEKLKKYLDSLQKQGHYTLKTLLDMYQQGKEGSKLKVFVAKLSAEMEKCGQFRTARAYRTVTRGLILFNRNRDIPLEHINSRLVKDFGNHLKNKGRLPNTISYYMRNLRAIYNKAIEENLISNHRNEKPFSGVYTGVTKTMKRALSLEEVQTIHALDFYTLLRAPKKDIRMKNLDIAIRYFYFSFYARGMCFVDLAYLKKNNISKGVLRYVRKKTGRQIEVRITNQMQAIIDSFAHQVKNSIYLFPILRFDNTHSCTAQQIRTQYETALRTQNNRLKQLALMAGIDKNLSTHVARHTWASIGKQQELPLQVICECLGHSSEKITQIYLNQLDNSLLDEANQRVASAVNRSNRYFR